MLDTSRPRTLEVRGSVRVDLVGGTLDLNPICLICPNVVTLNVATSLQAKVVLTQTERKGIEIVSHDYQSSTFFAQEDFSFELLYQKNHFQEMTFIAQILDWFKLHSGLKVELVSGAPAGSGLGGSSAMGVTFFKALSQWSGKLFNNSEMIGIVKDIEARILFCGPTGYQDYYPALHGGVLALHPQAGKVIAEQLYSAELKSALEQRLTLVYSGKSRLSGINNWEVYKAFFDKKEHVTEGLNRIAAVSYEAYQAIRRKDFDRLIELIGIEGSEREKLFPLILTDEMKSLHEKLKKESPTLGIKVCGAGGGGCFIFVHEASAKNFIQDKVKAAGMTVLPFMVESPL